MTTTDRGGWGGTTRSARNRNRRRHATDQTHQTPYGDELAHPRRRGRHAAEDSGVHEIPAWNPWATGLTPAVDGHGYHDPAYRAPEPQWNPWETGLGEAIGDAEVVPGTSGPFAEPGWDPWATRTQPRIDPDGDRQWTPPERPGTPVWADEEPVRQLPEPVAEPGWEWETGLRRVVTEDEPVTGYGLDQRWNPWETGLGEAVHHEQRQDWAGPAPDWTASAADWTGSASDWTASAADPYPEYEGPAETSDANERPGDAYPRERPQSAGRATARRGILDAALVRCFLYLGPLSVAVAATGALSKVAWPVTAVMLLLGWSSAQALTSVGVTVARRAGPSAAGRVVSGGFAAVTGLWCALVWVAPSSLLGPDRALAATVGIGGLLTLGSVTAALVTRSEGSVAAWFVPSWILATAVLVGSGGVGWAAQLPVETLLPAAIVAVAIRAFRPALIPSPDHRTTRITTAERKRGACYLVIGASQAICVALLWQACPVATPLLVALPLLLAVPVLETLITWHTARIDAGLDSAETPAELDRHIRNITAITLAGLMPPLAGAAGLAFAAYRLPSDARGLVLVLAAGTLLGGVFAVTFLLAARTRTLIAAALSALPPFAAVVLALFPSPSGPLPAAVIVLAATHLAGLLIVALTAADLRRTP
ncbi:hypothetical protein [Actinoplanes sp. NBRC 101535]|uniref:hypothetical protein n=1 Tax=Actinoplanes sp. NBRC 101535 TaxID=3032196 RepID=UPI0024A0CC74|nr:hypothetical protein [Actinoplanes sp. NBRC 101535]GLY04895.1 hypothetical protein Acsp01_52740 [Actinoplanes sp. NBRC 101535]